MSTEDDVRVHSAIAAFKEIILGGVPILLRQNETAFLAIMCTLTAADALAAYSSTERDVGKRFVPFVRNYFPAKYVTHAENLYKLRCRLLHNFSPAHFTLTHANPGEHLNPSPIGDTILSDESLFADLKEAALRFFSDVETKPAVRETMKARLRDPDQGGEIYIQYATTSD